MATKITDNMSTIYNNINMNTIYSDEFSEDMFEDFVSEDFSEVENHPLNKSVTKEQEKQTTIQAVRLHSPVKVCDDEEEDIIAEDDEDEFQDEEIIFEEDEEEEEIFEEDAEISNTIRLKILQEQNKKQLEGLGALDGKLNWVSSQEEPEKDIKFSELCKEKKTKPVKVMKIPKYTKYNPAKISVGTGLNVIKFSLCDKLRAGNKCEDDSCLLSHDLVGNILCRNVKNGFDCKQGDKCKFSHDRSTAIDVNYGGLDHKLIVCKFTLMDMPCSFGDKCRFSHDKNLEVNKDVILDLIKSKKMPCKSASLGIECRFGDRCKFSHDIPVVEKSSKSVLCKSITMGIQCKFGDKCKFSHENPFAKILCKSVTMGIPCKFGDKCKFAHSKREMRTPMVTAPQVSAPRMSTPQVSPSRVSPVVSRSPTPSRSRTPSVCSESSDSDKKNILCKNIFNIENGQIVQLKDKVCRFGNKCVFAHSRIEVENKIKSNLEMFKCSYQDSKTGCLGIRMSFVYKKDKDGKERKTRCYTNNGNRKCYKIHTNERVTDFIVRTQSK
ncbi:zinc finger CCCH domain-containing 37 [Iridovirus CN01]|nr:zinc finger CCCH domain-containing 37 [Iridovirus CN01]UPA43519.1 zinc finger CCCH domain-containing 37 [Iridovirus CN01]UPA43716.1 zinc finger CCCH domain-containing 37 [Iridovirus CN01]UPA43877.1 zinc finger CCCH domain-containing 37 [Iridovirus CN01]